MESLGALTTIVTYQGLLLVLMAGAASLAWAEENSPGARACLECHSRTHELLHFTKGAPRALRIEESLWRRSIHGQALLCTDCHQDIVPGKHPGKRKASVKGPMEQRAYIAAKSEACKRCHYSYYTRVLDSIHFKLKESGDEATPTCADCHPAHSMKDPRARLAISARCGTCHRAIYSVYRNSVHGRSLEDSHNQDAPVCTDCHTAHSIADPRTAEFHAQIPTLCAKCHSDEAKMKRNGLSTAAFTTYVDDFHGRSNRIYNNSTLPPPKIVASCTDCHGIHDIAAIGTKHPSGTILRTESRAQVRERLVLVCRRCHAGVPLTFADAWLSHYPARPDTAPFLWSLKKFYAVFNPLMIGIFIFNILLNLWRIGVRRVVGKSR